MTRRACCLPDQWRGLLQGLLMKSQYGVRVSLITGNTHDPYYDSQLRLIKSNRPSRNTTVLAYDANTHATSITDKKGVITRLPMTPTQRHVHH